MTVISRLAAAGIAASFCFAAPCFGSEFATRNLAAAALIPAGTAYVVTQGYAAAGDYGGGLYIPAPGSTACGFQSADGQFWKLSSPAVNVRQCGAVCDGSTDDWAAIRSALIAANGITLTYPPGAVCGVSNPVDYCNAPTCADGGAGTSYPLLTDGNGATLRMLPAGAGNRKVLFVENNNSFSPGYMRVTIKNLKIDANGFAGMGLQVNGCGYCSFLNINETGATQAGCSFEGYQNFGFYYNLIERVTCENNAGNGVQEYTYTAGGPYGGGILGCTLTNNANTFIDVSSINNGFRGFDINCAHNVHIGADAEINVGTGFVFTNILFTAEFFGGYSEGNACNRCQNGVLGGDSTALNMGPVTPQSGIIFIGGLHRGTFSGLNAANNDIVGVPAAAGFGFIPNCSGSGRACVGVP